VSKERYLFNISACGQIAFLTWMSVNIIVEVLIQKSLRNVCKWISLGDRVEQKW